MIILSSVVISTARFFYYKQCQLCKYADRMKLFSSLHNELKSVPWLAAMPVNQVAIMLIEYDILV